MRKAHWPIHAVPAKWHLCFISNLFFLFSSAQSTAVKQDPAAEKFSAVSAGADLPVGDFSSTHSIGIVAAYASIPHPFGEINSKKIDFTYNGGLAYYPGKKETVSGYAYDYPGYFFIHAFAGIAWNPVTNGMLLLTAGPALGIYNATTRFTLGTKLELSYFLNEKFGVGPGIIFMKEPGADPLWAAGLKVTMVLQQ